MSQLGFLWSRVLAAWLLSTVHRGLVRAEGFTYPTQDSHKYLVGDLVNVTWDLITPRISLYEECATPVLLEYNVSNTQSYVWNATRDHYTESGCVFQLVPLTADGSLNPPNLTSVYFGVNKRYSNDPAPTSYNFGGSTSSTATSSATTSSTISTVTASSASTSTSAAAAATTTATHPTTAATTGITTAQKVGLGLGVPLGVLALSLAGAFLCMSRRRREGRGAIEPDQTPVSPSAQQQQSYTIPQVVEQVAPPKSPFEGSWMSRVSGAETSLAELPAGDVEVAGQSEMRASDRPVSELLGTPRIEVG
ncbi:uncharacterized protein BP01DRAFT_408840 [Aspergillus saccharolyticus JOP 1030-1]|uniref:Mid2 domain-containing protein n=1 Tax=Aspergillus saccharolyticus JOP 1030-1 TaxID=1450539 RepID=A0A318Z1H8_9EURO|nr:hypothetical protein BP01DRAFT_408840 [Aspergillus saccharolyticus JOP 1030-1]PYH40876.1 hypothetical protein BP01DRAFT_408840 [Aspergillus saccharolyticus JOP 1030-1]